jgi:ribosomal protein S4
MLLERRLDNIVFRMHFAEQPQPAAQLVNMGTSRSMAAVWTFPRTA